MSKIETYKTKRGVADRIARDVHLMLGRDGPRNDKATVRVNFTRLINDHFAPMGFSIDCAYGYYGSSSGYSATSEALGRYLAIAIDEKKIGLLDRAVELAAADAEKARVEAESEARAVLETTAA